MKIACEQKKLEKKIYLSSPTMHGEELEYMKKAYETNWMSTVGENINEVERIVAELIGCKSFCGLAAAIVIILLISHTINEPLIYAVLRSSQTVIGVSVAWLINVKLFPYHGHKKA